MQFSRNIEWVNKYVVHFDKCIRWQTFENKNGQYVEKCILKLQNNLDNRESDIVISYFLELQNKGGKGDIK